MQAKNIALATVLAAVFAGNAFAAQPAAGEGPLFLNEPATVSTLTRAEVTQQAIANLPATDANLLAAKAPVSASKVTRAEVRQQTREALAAGYQVKSGEMS
ncbi:hypothetical protein [Ottowia sp. VDI28]|uniref:hypothetical protein n=3 Tax=unclassified Ottowia TaxID=2645081 RepID=UPI003C304EA0